MNNTFEYIASGCGFTRMFLEQTYNDLDTVNFINDIFDKMNANPITKFGILFNAFVENRFGSVVKNHYVDHVHSVHADSGGLQMVTRGLNITPELKKQIYKTQAAYSDIAMCFDEIPLSFTGAKSSRLDLSNRWFDKEKFEQCARLTGKNIHDQINIFLDEKSKAKPMFIAQGNCYDTYMQWTDFAFQEIPKDKHKYVGGVAMGAAALGHGVLEDIERAFIFTQLPIECKSHLHLLAVGSVARLLPTLIFSKTGVYKDTHISYDSTTHTSALHFGRFYVNESSLDFPKHENKVIHGLMYQDIKDKFDCQMSYEDMLFILNHTNKTYSEITGKPMTDVSKMVIMVTFASISNFISHTERLMSSKSELLKFAGKDATTYNTLFSIKTLDDFKHWESQIGSHISSHAVSDTKLSTLEDFFC